MPALAQLRGAPEPELTLRLTSTGSRLGVRSPAPARPDTGSIPRLRVPQLRPRRFGPSSFTYCRNRSRPKGAALASVSINLSACIPRPLPEAADGPHDTHRGVRSRLLQSVEHREERSRGLVDPFPQRVQLAESPRAHDATRFGRVWRAVRDQAQLPTVRFHDMRHTFASTLLSGGVSVAAAADYLGHSPAMLLSTYAHVMSADHDRARAAVLRAFTRSTEDCARTETAT
jgi:Phage integrase family